MALRRAAALALAAVAPAAALRRLEPADGRAVHLGGQDPADFAPYAAFMNASGAGPFGYMTYLGVSSLNGTAANATAPWFVDFNATLSSYGDGPADWFLVPQIGLSLPHKGGEEAIANGTLDNALRALVAGLRSLQRPVFMRIGYEMNGPWNDYHSTSYKGAWRRIASFIRSDAVLNRTVALVWDRTCDELNEADNWWPGDDDQVDWVGVNIYSDHSAPGDTSCVEPFLKGAHAQAYPVLLGEVAPRGKHTTDPGTWDSWFRPYFGLFAAYPRLKATSYISRDWDANPAYKGWGDSRIATAAPSLRGNYTAAMRGARWLNKAGQAAVLAALGLTPADFQG